MFDIQLHDQHFGDNLIQTINGRDIHRDLGIGRDYSNWVKDQIESLKLIENVDYVVFTEKGGNPLGGRPRTEYHFTVEIAKHIALVSHTDKGREYRQQLIDMQSAIASGRYSFARPTPPAPLSIPERIDSIRSILSMVEEVGLVDDFTRIIARESLQNLLREAGSPGGQLQTLLPQHSQISDYFQIEDFRSELCGTYKLSGKEWLGMRGAIGKAVRIAIQDAYSDAQPMKTSKHVAGAERSVNAWHRRYHDIAIEAAHKYIQRHRR